MKIDAAPTHEQGQDVHEDGGLSIPFKRDPLGVGPLAPALGHKRPAIGGYEP